MDMFSRLFILVFRIYLPCLIAAPLILLASWVILGARGPVPNPLNELTVLIFWSVIEFVVALVIGLPLAVQVVRRVHSFAARTIVLTLAGGVIASAAFALFAPMPAALLIGAPTGMITALLCCLFNARRLGQAVPNIL